MLNRPCYSSERILILLLLISIFCAPCLSWGQVSKKKSLTRRYDPVIVPVKKIKSLFGGAAAGLRIFAMQEGELKLIPFQVDERDPDGEFIYTEGPEANAPDKDDKQFRKGRPDGALLDANDEIVFMVRDAGDQITSDYLFPEDPEVWELILNDPLTGALGWVYLAVYKEAAKAPAPSPLAYIQFDPKTEQVRTPSYHVKYGNNAFFNLDYLSMSPWQPGSNEPFALNQDDNLLDRLKIRVNITGLGGRLTLFNRNEEDIRSRFLAYKTGPVRVLSKIANNVNLMLGIRAPSITISPVFTSYHLDVPFRLWIPFKIGRFVSSVELRTSMDFINLTDWYFVCNKSPAPITINGKDTEEKRKLKDLQNSSWFAVEGPEGLIFWRMKLSEKASDIVKRKLYFVDNPLSMDPPENVPGQSPNLGTRLTGIEQLKSGRYFFNIKICPIADGKLGSERALLDIDDRPLIVSVVPFTNKDMFLQETSTAGQEVEQTSERLQTD